MNDLTNRALYHAKTGNFAGFCVSVSTSRLDEDLRELFDNVRSNMKMVEEETISWFNLEEYAYYVENVENIPQYISESASIATRMKLRRAAKRTSSRRARKRYIKRGIRKNAKTLARRAYTQVKTLLRKRLTGGRSWSSLPLASRARIDNAINKRRPMLKRLVKNRITKMPSQETKRLQRVRLNSSFEYSPLLRRLMEENKEEIGREKDTERQREYRGKRDSNLEAYIKNLVVVKTPAGEEKIIAKQSVTSKHEVIIDPGDLQMGKAQNITKDDSFVQTRSSVHLFGLFKKMTGKEKRVLRAGYKEFKKENMEKTETSEIRKKRPLAAQGTVHNPTQFEIGVTVVSKLTLTGNLQVALGLLGNAQQAVRSQNAPGPGSAPAEIYDVEKEALEKLTGILKKAGLTNKETKLILSNESLLPAAARLYAFLEKNADKTPRTIAGGIGNINNYTMLNAGRSQQETLATYFGTDATFKSDILLVDNGILKIDGVKSIEDHKNQILLSYSTPRTGAKGNSVAIAAAILYRDKFILAAEGTGIVGTGIIGVSMKTGDARFMSGNVEADGAAAFGTAGENVLKRGGDGAEALVKSARELWKSIDDTYDKLKARLGKGEKGKEQLHIPGGQAKGVRGGDPVALQLEKFMDDATEKINDLLNSPAGLPYKIELMRTALTGNHKFNKGSPGYATHVLTAMTLEGEQGTISEITDDYLYGLAPDIIVRFSAKSGRLRAKEERALVQDKPFNDALKIQVETAIKTAQETHVDKNGQRKQLTKGDIDDISFTTETLFRKNTTAINEDLKTIPSEELLKQYDKGGVKENTEKYSILKAHKDGLRNSMYAARATLTMINRHTKQDIGTSQIQNNHFSYNPLLRFLVEQDENTLLNTDTQEDDGDFTPSMEVIEEYMEMAKDYIGNDISKILEFLEIYPSNISYTDVDLHEYRDKRSNAEVNTIYINDRRIEVPVDQDVDYDELVMSEHYINIGKAFLAEAKKRNYRKEYDNYQGTKEQIANRTKRVLARRILAKMGRVHKGDGKDVDHKDGNPQNNSPKNLRAIDKSTNRAKH